MPRNIFTNKYLRFNEESEKYLALRKVFRKATGGKRWKPGVLNRLGSASSQKARDIEAAIVAQRDVLNTVMAKKQKETNEIMKNQTLSIDCESHKLLKSIEIEVMRTFQRKTKSWQSIAKIVFTGVVIKVDKGEIIRNY